ncbi:hypothetical protein BSKO_11369 [Bryopsis sp. KO-2023]|nr:hypothetical protein BSKO_11369 [Bryopsis sp. KO-2023]
MRFACPQAPIIGGGVLHSKAASSSPRSQSLGLRTHHDSRRARVTAQARDRSEHDSDVPQISEDWRAFRAHLVAEETHNTPTMDGRWAHELAAPEKGCLLVARRFDMGAFNHSVVLLLEHGDTIGTRGLILNHPLPVGMLKDNHPEGKVPEVACYVGGPVEMRTVTLMHDRRIPGATEIVQGVYYGGNTAELAELSPEQKWKRTRMFLGTSCWAPHQLSAELHDAPAWYILAASKDVIFGKGNGMDLYDEDYTRSFWEDIIRISNVDFPEGKC